MSRDDDLYSVLVADILINYELRNLIWDTNFTYRVVRIPFTPYKNLFYIYTAL